MLCTADLILIATKQNKIRRKAAHLMRRCEISDGTSARYCREVFVAEERSMSLCSRRRIDRYLHR